MSAARSGTRARGSTPDRPKRTGGTRTVPAARARPASSVCLDAPVPDFTLPGTDAADVRLRALRGRNVVLYFYPRDNTPGCTLEGQDFARLHARFSKAGTLVFGISRDSVASHEKFRQKMGYPFPLLSDTDERVCHLFDVIREKNMYGRRVFGIERSTFLIDASGVLRREWRKVKIEGHAQEVLEAALTL